MGHSSGDGAGSANQEALSMIYRCMFCGTQVPACGKPVDAVLASRSDVGALVGLQTAIGCGCAPGHTGRCMGSCGPSCPCRPAGSVHPEGCGCGRERESSSVCEECRPHTDWATMTCSRPGVKRPGKK